MGNQPSSTSRNTSGATSNINGHNNQDPYRDDDDDDDELNNNNGNSQTTQPCIPCFALFSNPLSQASRGHLQQRQRRRNGSDPMGSPLPATPPMQRHKREQVAAAMSAQVLQKATSSTGSASSSSLFLPPKYGSKVLSSPPLPSSSVAPVHEGPDAEALLHATYELLQVLGVGSTSTVQSARHRTTGEMFACKIIDVQQIEERFAGMMTQFQTEIAALRQLQHPGIIRLYDVYMTTHKIYIIMECMQGGELFDYVVQKGTLTEEEASHIVRKVTSALVYMHEQNICHRDLKPENLLLKSKPSGTGVSAHEQQDIDVKIIDFGLSKVRPQCRL